MLNSQHRHLGVALGFFVVMGVLLGVAVIGAETYNNYRSKAYAPPPNPIPNCTGLTGPSSVTIGQSATYTASFSSEQGNLGGEIDAGQGGQFKWTPGNKPISGTSGSLSFTWTPTVAGTYDVFCRAWNDAVAECRGKANYVDGPPRYACAGPASSMSVTVAAAVVPTVTQAACNSKTKGDANCDGTVDLIDYSVWLNHQCNKQAAGAACTDLRGDFNGDGSVDDADLQIWKNNYLSDTH